MTHLSKAPAITVGVLAIGLGTGTCSAAQNKSGQATVTMTEDGPPILANG